MADLGYNIFLHIIDDGDRLTLESDPWLNELAGTQTGEAFTAVKFPNLVWRYNLCSPTRGDLLTGVGNHGIIRHGNAPVDGSGDPGASVRLVAAGTPGGWFGSWTKEDQLTYWVRRRGRSVFYAGKWLNNNGWGTDARMPKGVDQPFIILDDSDLGGAHATHVGSRYLGNSTVIGNTTGPMVYLIDDAGATESHTGGSDPYTAVGYTQAAYNARVGATDYVTDLLQRKLRQWVAGAFGVGLSEPFFAVMSHRGSHGAWLPAARHSASTIYVTGASGTAVATDGSTDPPGFNSAPLTAWDQADKPALTSGQITQVRADRITKARTTLSVSEAIHDAYWLSKTLQRPSVHIILSDNGFPFGQNRDTSGKCSPYAATAFAPMWVLWPSGTGRRTESNALVTPTDVSSLIMALCGARPTVASDGMGAELLRIVDGTNTGGALRTHAPFRFTASNEYVQPSFAGLQTTTRRIWRTSSYTDLTKGGTVYAGETVATDLSSDPGETANVAASASWVPEMMARLEAVG